MNWINSFERLPNFGKWVLTIDHWGNIGISSFTPFKGWYNPQDEKTTVRSCKAWLDGFDILEVRGSIDPSIFKYSDKEFLKTEEKNTFVQEEARKIVEKMQSLEATIEELKNTIEQMECDED